MDSRLQKQLAEALGPVNCWFCSQAYGMRIDNHDLLMTYFIRSGGAADFDRRFKDAMGPLNRWYCSQFHQQDVGDLEILWDYYMEHYTSVSSVNRAIAC